MKHLKVLLFVLVTAFSFAFGSGTAKAQVVIKARVNAGPYFYHGRHYAHRRPYWRRHHRYYRYY